MTAYKDIPSRPVNRKNDCSLVAVISVLLIISIYIVYGQTRRFEFVSLDTPYYVYANPKVQSGLNWDSIKWSFTSTEFSNWHPVTWLSHILDIELFGLEPGAHHRTSVLIHITNTVLLFIFLYLATGYVWRCALVAAFFALHPLHVESVAWVAERKDVLCGFFFCASLLAYRQYILEHRVTWYLVTVLFFILGFMSKPMIVTLPFLLLVLDYWPFNRVRFGPARANGISTDRTRPRYRIFLEKVPLICLSAGMCILILKIQKSSGAVTGLDALSFGARGSNALLSYVAYLKSMFWPLNLCVYYPLKEGAAKITVATALVLIIVISALSVKYRNRYSWLMSGWLWYAGMLVPVIGIVQVGAQARADRYTYLPLIGIFIIVAWLMAKVAEKSTVRKRFVAVFSIAALLVLATLAHRQIGYWENSTKLYQRALRVTAENGFAHYNFAVELSKQNRIEASVSHLEAALKIDPTDAMAHNMLGLNRVKAGEPDRAISHFVNAIQLDESYTDACINLAGVYKKLGALDNAIKVYELSLSKNPDCPELYNNLATALISKGEMQKAIEHFKYALEIDPDNSPAQRNLKLAQRIETGVKEICLVDLEAGGTDKRPANAVEDRIERMRDLFARFKIPISQENLEKLARKWNSIPNDRGKNVP